MSKANAEKYVAKVLEIVDKLPPGTVGALGLLFDGILAGKPNVAAANARVVSQSLAIKAAARAPYRAKR